MRGVASLLAPGGRLVVVEFHPLFAVFEPGWVVERSYFGDRGGWRCDEGIQDYVGYLADDPAEAAEARAWVNPHALRRVPVDRSATSSPPCSAPA